MDEEAAVYDLGSVDAAATSVVESMPTIQRSFCNLRQNHERTALVTVPLVLGALAWVPVVFAIAMMTVAVYVLLWSLILAAWAFVASGYVFGLSSIIAFILGATSDNWVAGAAALRLTRWLLYPRSMRGSWARLATRTSRRA